MKLIYTKSGFYLKETHGFFTILSKSTTIFISWIPEYLIHPNDLCQFIQYDGLLKTNLPEIQVNLGQDETTLIMLKNVHSFHLQPPSLLPGFIQITTPTQTLNPLYFFGKTAWPGDDMAQILHRLTDTTPLETNEWLSLFDTQGKPSRSIPRIVFERGLCPQTRPEAWKFLLGIYSWQSTTDERRAIDSSQREAYDRIKRVWSDDPEMQATKRFLDEKHSIEIDLHRTDHEMLIREDLEAMKNILISYNVYNTELGYSQGMSDILAPLWVTMKDEVWAFWAFCGFMDRIQHNFFMDQTGMQQQIHQLEELVRFMDPVLYERLRQLGLTNMLFSFRWLLVWFKREFEWEDCIKLWEFMWTDWLSSKMVLFVALAVMDQERNRILNELEDFDDVLRHMDHLSGHIDLKLTLKRSQQLFHQFEKKIQEIEQQAKTIKERLMIRSVWNSEQRHELQQDLENLKISEILSQILLKKNNNNKKIKLALAHQA
ncbi:unnamed protein product [Rhizopus stolonifer]